MLPNLYPNSSEGGLLENILKSLALLSPVDSSVKRFVKEHLPHIFPYTEYIIVMEGLVWRNLDMSA